MSLSPIAHSDWITPEEQRLAVPLARDLIYVSKDMLRENLPVTLPLMRALLYPSDEMRALLHSQGENVPQQSLEYKITECLIRSILRRSNLPGSETQIPSLMDLTVERLFPPSLTNWYTALKRLDLLPEKIPPLPTNIREILDSPCPLPKKWRQELKPDGTPWKISDTHLLYLVPAGTVNELKSKVSAYGQAALNARGEKLYPNANPLCFSWPYSDILREHGNVPVEAEWILMSKADLEGSERQPLSSQIELLRRVSVKAGTEYQIPSLKQVFACTALHKVATEESLFNYEILQDYFTMNTRVKETFENAHLYFGSFFTGGMLIGICAQGGLPSCGITALQKL